MKKVVSNAVATVSANATASTPTATAAPATGASLIFLQPPPADAKIPAPPSGAAQPDASAYRSVTPRATELAALPSAVENLQRFTAFTTVFGAAGLPYAQVLQAFTVGNQWSTMRKASAAWDAFSRTEEGLSWGTIRSIMERLGPLWDIAAAADPSLAVTFPGVATLFGAKKAIARKGASTRRLNKEAIARGDAPIHGISGKRRKKASDKALAAAAKAAGLTATPAAGASPATPPATASTVTTVASAAPPANGGAPHS
jgi:hypothetical protein